MKYSNLSNFVSLLVFFLFLSINSISAAIPNWIELDKLNKKTSHVFLPNQNVYFDLVTEHYIYVENGSWVSSMNKPSFLEEIDLNREIKVRLRLKDNTKLYKNNSNHLKMYGKAGAAIPIVKTSNTKKSNVKKSKQTTNQSTAELFKQKPVVNDVALQHLIESNLPQPQKSIKVLKKEAKLKKKELAREQKRDKAEQKLLKKQVNKKRTPNKKKDC